MPITIRPPKAEITPNPPAGGRQYSYRGWAAPRIIAPIIQVPTVNGSSGGVSLSNVETRPPPTERTLTTSALNAPIQVAYGQVEIGAQICFLPTIFGTSLVIGFSLGEGPIDSVLRILVDGHDIGVHTVNGQEPLGLTAGTDYNVHLGNLTAGGVGPAVDPLLAAADTNHITGWPGLAYIAIKFPAQTTIAYDPTRVVVEGKWLTCIDSRVDLTTRTWSANPSVHLYDLMTNPRYGLGTPYVHLANTEASDDCDFTLARPAAPVAAPTLGTAINGGGALTGGPYAWSTSYTNAAGIESVESPPSADAGTLAGGQQPINWAAGPAGTTAISLYRNRLGAFTSPRLKVITFANNTTLTYNDGVDDLLLGSASITQGRRYEMGLVLRDALPASEWINKIRAHFNAHLAYNIGVYNFFVEKARAATSIVFDETNIVGIPRIRSKGLSQLPTKVVGIYTDRGQGYNASASAEAELPGIATLMEERRELRLNLEGVMTVDQMQRLVTMNLNRSAADKEVSWDTFPDGVMPLPGDVVSITHSIGLSNTLVIELDCQPDHDGLLWHHKGEFYDASIYSDTVVAQPQT